MSLNFISDENFKKHIRETILQYGDSLQPYDLKKFNGNIIDPIKLLFDKNIYGVTWEEIIQSEIFRQRDKSNNNSIGYFHQNIFRYIAGCTVPKSGWDVIFKKDHGIEFDGDKVGTIYVEMKNKHNTMNSSSGAKTFMKMQGQLLSDNHCACYLVEVIAKKSQNIPWIISLDGQRQQHSRIRRVSIDKFYELVTGEKDAFYKMCMALPGAIKEILEGTDTLKVPNDTVFVELKEKAAENSFELALFILGFETYSGFKENFLGRRGNVS
ncbi:MAG: Eco47II family restriction endonuclease [Selenomonadaceae bacterium]|nr:Eco47II family restriction endonuclease [Selenomonadaceae bacterium]